MNESPWSSLPLWVRDRRAWPLAVVGLVLVASGMAHVGVWAMLGGPWEGSVSWRKPILFGISTGLTGLSLGWAWSQLPWRRGDGWLAVSAAVAMLIEVAVIDLQCWRGVASHFNRSTPLDAFLSDVTGVLILWVMLIAVDLTVRVFRQPIALPADMLLAVRAGLVLLVISCGLGIWVSINGGLRQAAGLEPDRYGVAGVPKFPHGIVIHSLQWLPMIAWAARQTGIAVARRWWLVTTATVGTVFLGVYALLQTLEGRTRFDTTPATAAVLAAALAGHFGPVVMIFLAVVREYTLRRVPPHDCRPSTEQPPS